MCKTDLVDSGSIRTDSCDSSADDGNFLKSDGTDGDGYAVILGVLLNLV